MEFQLRWIEDGWHVDAMLERGLKPPDWVQDRPDMERCDEFIINAFFELGTCRSGGMSVGPIPWTAVYSYTQSIGMDRYNTDAFIHIIRAMDMWFLKWSAEKVEKQRAAAKTKEVDNGSPIPNRGNS